MKIMGIDPGLTGGLAFYDGENLEVFATPVVVEHFIKNGKKATRSLMDLKVVSAMIKHQKPDRAVLEKVAARSGQGVTSMFRFGMNFGEHRGILTALEIPFIEATPQAWKKVFLLNSDKDDSLDLAREVFPSHAKTSFKLKKHNGLAEAALIAKYGFDNPID
jgi:crossover junction endodeoxyribonuclease RuvC